jgi:uncharacterized membrane protein YccF (DUF307 family)
MSKYGMGLLRSARLTRRQLIVFALVSAILNGIVTACVGTWLAQTYATQQSRRKSVETLAHLIYDRRTRAGMVVSSLRRNAPIEEIQYRKRAYDEAYVDWNKNILLNLFAIREVAGHLKFATLAKAFEDELVGSMADVDRCLTQAYDHKLKGEDVAPMLEACHMATMHQFVLDCGATFTDELYKLTSFSFMPFSHALEERKRLAEINIKANCTSTPEAPPLTSPTAPASPAPPTAGIAPPVATGTMAPAATPASAAEPAPAATTAPTATEAAPPAAPTPAP